jgi:hypothetical protein
MVIIDRLEALAEALLDFKQVGDLERFSFDQPRFIEVWGGKT